MRKKIQDIAEGEKFRVPQYNKGIWVKTKDIPNKEFEGSICKDEYGNLYAYGNSIEVEVVEDVWQLAQIKITEAPVIYTTLEDIKRDVRLATEHGWDYDSMIAALIKVEDKLLNTINNGRYICYDPTI